MTIGLSALAVKVMTYAVAMWSFLTSKVTVVGSWLTVKAALVLTWIGDILDAMTEGFTNLGTAILTFIKTGFMDLFLIYTESGGTITVQGASYFGIFTFVCLGIALTVSLTHWITNLCRRKI